MDESTIDRIERLERSNRFWKTTSYVLIALLLSLITGGATLFVSGRQQAMRAAAAAMRQEQVARQQVEAARQQALQAERAVRAAKEAKQN